LLGNSAWFDFLWDFADGYREKTGAAVTLLEALDIARDHLANCSSSPIKVIDFEEVKDGGGL
jgi:hypothetical protein